MISISDKSVLKSGDFSEVAITKGLVGWYPLDRSAHDLSLVGNDGVIAGSPRPRRAPPGMGMRFNGVTDKVEIPHIPSLAVQSEGWAYAYYFKRYAGYPSGNTTMVKQGDWEIGTWMNGGNVRPHFKFGDTVYYLDVPYVLPLNTWVHFTAVWDGTKILFYIDGIEKSGISGQSTRPNPIGPLMLMSDYGAPTAIDAAMSDLRIFQRSLPASEVSLLYELTHPDYGSIIRETLDQLYVKGRYREVIM